MRVTTTDLQNAFGKYLALVAKEDIIVLKNGKSVAKLIHYTEPDFFIVHEEVKDYQSTKKISYEEYVALVNSSDQRYELIDGEVYLLASPSFSHQVIVNEIAGYFYNYFWPYFYCPFLRHIKSFLIILLKTTIAFSHFIYSN